MQHAIVRSPHSSWNLGGSSASAKAITWQVWGHFYLATTQNVTCSSPVSECICMFQQFIVVWMSKPCSKQTRLENKSRRLFASSCSMGAQLNHVSQAHGDCTRVPKDLLVILPSQALPVAALTSKVASRKRTAFFSSLLTLSSLPHPPYSSLSVRSIGIVACPLSLSLALICPRWHFTLYHGAMS